MTALLQVWLVKYRCSCSSWFPLSQLYFCRKCAQLKCPMCLSEEIDIIFCPNCLEKTTSTEALQKRFRCAVCHECPMCRNLLSVRSQADLYYLQCNACQWTSRELGMPDRAATNEPWPELANPMEPELNKVMGIMKSLGNYERLERELSRRSCLSNYEMMGNYEQNERDTTKRLFNLGILNNDRFSLQNAYNMRRKALHQRTEVDEKLELLAPSADVPELDPDIFTEPPKPEDTLGLAQTISHPLTSGVAGQLYPSKVKMISRRALRCLECETMLYKGEISPNVVKPRLQSFALDHFPEARISRPVQLVPGQNSAFFLTLTNNSMHPMDISLSGQRDEDDENCVDTSKFSAQFMVPNRDNAEESGSSSIQHILRPEYAADPNEINNRVLYISQHRAGICVECLPSPNGTAHYALFKLNFSSDNPEQKFTTDVRVQLARPDTSCHST